MPTATPRAESFFATLQTDLLDRQSWATRNELAQAIFEYVEAFYNPIRRHSSLGMLAPNDYEHRHNDVAITAAA
jgi:transposase InsO family protein